MSEFPKIRQTVPGKMSDSNQNNKAEYDGLKLRPIFPQDKIEWHKQQTIGKTEEDRLEELYSKLSDWLSEVKVLEKRGSIELLPYLKQAMAKAKSDGRIPDCSDETALSLGKLHSGPDLLLFFVRKCPHASEALLKGELPPYPWRISQDSGQEQKPAEAEQKAKTVIVPIITSLTVIFLIELFVYIIPVTWITNHPHSYGIQAITACLIFCLIVGFFRPGLQKWWWWAGACTFLAALLSLM